MRKKSLEYRERLFSALEKLTADFGFYGKSEVMEYADYYGVKYKDLNHICRVNDEYGIDAVFFSELGLRP